MKNTSAESGHALKSWALIFCVGVLPIVGLVAGCSTGSRHPPSTGEYVDDHGLSARVQSALRADTRYKYYNVVVVASNGVVQLSGMVHTKSEKNRAGNLAKQVAGIREIQNNLTVKE